MTRNQYLEALKRLGLSHQSAGRMLGVSPRQAQRFASGESPIPTPVAKLLQLMIERELKPEDIPS